MCTHEYYNSSVTPPPHTRNALIWEGREGGWGEEGEGEEGKGGREEYSVTIPLALAPAAVPCTVGETIEKDVRVFWS